MVGGWWVVVGGEVARELATGSLELGPSAGRLHLWTPAASEVEK